jgi:hypothetical protein
MKALALIEHKQRGVIRSMDKVKDIINSIAIVKHGGEWKAQYNYPQGPFEISAEDCTLLIEALGQASAEAKHLSKQDKKKNNGEPQ